MKARSAILFGLSGSIGNMTARKAKDGTTILSQKIVNPTPSNSTAQLAQRSIFTVVQRLGTILLSVLGISFKILKPTHSNYNSFVSVNTKRLQGVNMANVAEQMEALQVARGSTARPSIEASVENSGTSTANILAEWVDQSGNGLGNANDPVDVLIVNPATGAIDLQPMKAVRDEVLLRIDDVPAINYPQYVYLFFRDVATNECSDSLYLGVFTSATAVDISSEI